jgi:hypothetical protein
MPAKHGLSALAALIWLGAAAPSLAQDRVSDTNYYAAYYDGKYGPIADGYWGRDRKNFWYKDRSGQWHQDDGSHFQHDAANGFIMVHGSGAARQH